MTKDEYTALLESSIKSKDERNTQLQLDNDKLRKALEYQLTRTDDIIDIRLIGEALSITSQPESDVLNSQTTQKPIGEINSNGMAWFYSKELAPKYGTKLYSQTVQKPLSDEEITKMANIWGNGYQPVIIDFARAIEKSHGIGE